jgi:hypothetical protein
MHERKHSPVRTDHPSNSTAQAHSHDGSIWRVYGKIYSDVSYHQM